MKKSRKKGKGDKKIEKLKKANAPVMKKQKFERINSLHKKIEENKKILDEQKFFLNQTEMLAETGLKAEEIESIRSKINDIADKRELDRAQTFRTFLEDLNSYDTVHGFRNQLERLKSDEDMKTQRIESLKREEQKIEEHISRLKAELNDLNEKKTQLQTNATLLNSEVLPKMEEVKSKNTPLLVIIIGVIVLLTASLLSLIDDSSHQFFVPVIFGSIAIASALSIKLLKRRITKNQNGLHAKTRQNSVLELLTKYLVQSISKDVLRSGRPENTVFIVKKFQKHSLVSAAVVIPLMLLLFVAAQIELAQIEQVRISIVESTVEIEDPELLSQGELPDIQQSEPTEPILASIAPFLAAALGAVPLLLLFYPKIMYTGLRKGRKTMVEEELPFFSLYAAILQSVGVDLYSSFIITIGKNVFKIIEKEALLLKRNVEFFARSPLEALEELGRNHDSMAFKNFLLGYSSIARSGGDLSRYLETRAEEHFNMLKLKYSAYSRNVGYLVEALIVVLVIVPVLVVVSAFILPAATISQLIVMSGVAVPILTIVFAILLVNIQPRMFNVVGLKDITVLAFLPAAIISFLFFTFLGLEPWISLALAAIIPCTINEYFTMKHKRQIEFMESALPNFLRDVTEYRKIGFHEITAIIRISKENRYNSVFDRLLRTLSTLLEQGYTPTQIMKSIKIRSWFARVTLFTLAHIAESGGGNPAVLESITGFVSNVRMTLREAKSSISIYGILGYASPILLAFTVVVINEMLGTVTPDVLKGVGSESFTQLITISPLFNTTIKTFIVTSSIGTAILIGKAIDRTFKSTGRIAIACSLAIASLIITENISIPGLG